MISNGAKKSTTVLHQLLEKAAGNLCQDYWWSAMGTHHQCSRVHKVSKTKRKSGWTRLQQPSIWVEVARRGVMKPVEGAILSGFSWGSHRGQEKQNLPESAWRKWCVQLLKELKQKALAKTPDNCSLEKKLAWWTLVVKVLRCISSMKDCIQPWRNLIH